MSHKQNPPRQDRRNTGRAPVKRHVEPCVGTEKAAPGFFNPTMQSGKRQRAGLQAGMANARARNKEIINGKA